MKLNRLSLLSLVVVVVCAARLAYGATIVGDLVFGEHYHLLFAQNGAAVKMVDGHAHISGNAGMFMLDSSMIPKVVVPFSILLGFAVRGSLYRNVRGGAI